MKTIRFPRTGAPGSIRAMLPGPALVLLALLGFPATCLGATYFLAVDVPASLGGTTYQPYQILLSEQGAYSVALDLAGQTSFLSLHRPPGGPWLFSVPDPFSLGGATTAQPNDVVSYDGSSFSLLLDGSALGIPDYARIDALFVSGGDPVMSFDVPVRIGGVEYSPSDLVLYSSGTFSSYWDAEPAGVPPTANLVGADQAGDGLLVLSFDVPVNLGGVNYLPGQLVRWDGGTAFSGYALDGAWPPGCQLRDFSLVWTAGSVPDSGGVPGTPLLMDRDGSTGDLTLSWGASCSGADSDYEIYEGFLGIYYSHTQKFCSTGGSTTTTFPDPGEDVYYLVVPRNGDVVEGSYGRASNGSERPQGTAACLPREIAASCP